MKKRRRSKFFDPGKGGIGGHRRRKGATAGICVECKKTQIVAPNAWFRVGRPTCRHCGGFLEPSDAAQERFLLPVRAEQADQDRRCVCCNAVLRSANKDIFCGIKECQKARGSILAFAIGKKASAVRVASAKVLPSGCIAFVGQIGRRSYNLPPNSYIIQADSVPPNVQPPRLSKAALHIERPEIKPEPPPLPPPPKPPKPEPKVEEPEPPIVHEPGPKFLWPAPRPKKESIEAAIQKLSPILQRLARKFYEKNIRPRSGAVFNDVAPERSSLITSYQRQLMASLHEHGVSFREIEEIMHLYPTNGNAAYRQIRKYKEDKRKRRKA